LIFVPEGEIIWPVWVEKASYMSSHVLVWDLETVPDIKGFAAANGHDGKSEDEIRAAIGDKFPKHLYHGKPDGISGAEIEKYFRDGHIREIADCCKNDVVNTYRISLRYELFRGTLAEAAFQAIESNLAEFIKGRNNTATPRLTELL
jgi:predicted PolB exonuclease-like 3'-5' exonuclease